MCKDYTIYFVNWFLMREGSITYSAHSKSDAIDKFRDDYDNDYEIIQIYD